MMAARCGLRRRRASTASTSRAGCLTAEIDPKGRATIYDRLPAGLPRLIPVGRLDYSTEGLLLMTNDGELKRQLELPSSGVRRTYRARAFGDVSQDELEKLAEGIRIEGINYGSIDANLERRTGRNCWIEMSLTEGKNREVRRVLEHLGMKVSRLIRTAYGPFTLEGLAPGMVDAGRARAPQRIPQDPEMRIIAGAWRGRLLDAPPGIATRPTADRVRETLFSMLASRLGSFEGLRVADLFAGSGALGFEALSRGASSATFVERDSTAIAAIRANAERLGAADRITILSANALNLPSAGPFDLVFADPPYERDRAAPQRPRSPPPAGSRPAAGSASKARAAMKSAPRACRSRPSAPSAAPG